MHMSRYSNIYIDSIITTTKWSQTILTIFKRFLVGALSLKEKNPTITVGSFFQLTISLWMVHFSYNSYNLTISYNSYLAYEVVFLHHLRNSTGPKGTPLEYFRLCETFFEFFFTEGSPSNFLIFSDRMVEKPQRVPLSFFWHCETFFKIFFHKRVPNSPILWHFEVLLVFLSLRYGADLGRSRLVLQLLNVSVGMKNHRIQTEYIQWISILF